MTISVDTKRVLSDGDDFAAVRDAKLAALAGVLGLREQAAAGPDGRRLRDLRLGIQLQLGLPDDRLVLGVLAFGQEILAELVFPEFVFRQLVLAELVLRELGPIELVFRQLASLGGELVLGKLVGRELVLDALLDVGLVADGLLAGQAHGGLLALLECVGDGLALAGNALALVLRLLGGLDQVLHRLRAGGADERRKADGECAQDQKGDCPDPDFPLARFVPA
jgi:hypothetical protein